MQKPLQITFRNIPHSDAIEERIRHHVIKLEEVCDRIQSCQVVVDAPHHHHHHGNLYHISIDITVPDKEIAVNREPPAHQAHQDCYVAIRDAFNAAQRQLKTYMDRHRHQVKTHGDSPRDRILEERILEP